MPHLHGTNRCPPSGAERCPHAHVGAEAVEVTLGDRILKDAINEALRDWVTNVKDTHYLLGTVAGPHPFPSMVRDFQKIIGEEAKQQLQVGMASTIPMLSAHASAAAPTPSAS